MTTHRLRQREARYDVSGITRDGGSVIVNSDALKAYDDWLSPTCIISDGPYGLGKYPGEPKDHRELPVWYAPHVAAWSRLAQTNTTLWFWNSEIGWAVTHPVLEMHGWEYQECCVWDKGISHVAGNCNSKTIRGTPVVTEVAVRYTRKNQVLSSQGELLAVKEWIRSEWLRSGLPMNQANDACGVANAATRKYLTQCHLWYFPPPDAMVKMAEYCARHGLPSKRPYFSIDGKSALTAARWEQMRSKWKHVHGVTNVWQSNAVHGAERVKGASGYLHANQKPLALLDFQIRSCTDPGDVVWEPFGGLCSASLAASMSARRSFAAEINGEYFQAATARLKGRGRLLERERDAA